MLNVEIKKGKGIDGVIRDITPGRIEDEKKVQVVGGNAFPRIMENFVLCLNSHVNFVDESTAGEVLTPPQINAFLQMTAVHEDHSNYHQYAGIFVSSLIQRSYDAGNNGFTLNTQNLNDLVCLAGQLKGTGSRPLMLTVEGAVGKECALYASHIDMTIKGDANFGLPDFSTDSVFTFHGYVSGFVDMVGINYSGIGSRNCTYKTPDIQTLKSLINIVKSEYREENQILNTCNKIVFIRPDGREKTVVDYAKRNK